MDSIEETKIDESVQRVANALSVHLDKKQDVELDEWTVSDVEIAMKKKYGKVDKKAIEKLKKVQHMGNVDRNDLVKVGHGKLNVESVELDEAMDKNAKLKIFNKLKKGDKIKIKYDSSLAKGKDYTTFVVTRNMSVVGKAKVEKIPLAPEGKTGGMKYYLYNRDGNVSFAMGDMGASIVDMKEELSKIKGNTPADQGRRGAVEDDIKRAEKKGDKKAVAKLKEAELDEAKYDIYHKDFSSAMQHAYVAAKKMYGITIDPKEIDDKVATGPKKPSKDKTNRYRLKGDKGTVQIQVANLDNKKYELNMYKEEVELDEAKYKYDGKVVKISKKEFAKVSKDYKNSTKGKERMMILDPKTQGSISVPVQFEEVKVATIKVGEDAIDTDEDIHYAVVKDRKVEAVGEKKEMIEYCKENGGRVWKTTKNIDELVEEVELDENAAVDALEKQAGVSNPTDKKFFQKAAELLKKKDYVALGQLIYDYDTAPREFAMSAIRDKDQASFKKMYGNQKGYFSTMKPKGLKEEVDESVQRAANAISHHEARKMSPVSRARQDALRDIGKDKSKDDDEVKATDADREKADRNILNKLKKSADVKGNYEIKFDKGPSKKVPYKIVKLALIKHAKMKPADKLKFQKQAEKSYVDFLKALKDM